jgi:NTP pyrophosphatase (non-canonical NTP hydrolase)
MQSAIHNAVVQKEMPVQEHSDDAMTLSQLKQRLEYFCLERGWNKGNAGSPDHISAAIITEANELLGCVKHLPKRKQARLVRNPINGIEARKEIADVLWFSLVMAERHGISLSQSLFGDGFASIGNGGAIHVTDEHTKISDLKSLALVRYGKRYLRLSPKDLAVEMISEASALFEHFRFRSPEQIKEMLSDDAKMMSIRKSLGKVFGLILIYSANNSIDLSSAVLEKLSENEERYSAVQLNGTGYQKYTEIRRK